MKSTVRYLLFSIFLTFIACSKIKKIIDVNSQWNVNENAYVLNSPQDGQWVLKSFTAQEMKLFEALDTTNLIGTITPQTVNETPPRTIYPNPFHSKFYMSFSFENGYTGSIVFKAVIVDNIMRIQFAKAVRIDMQNNQFNIALLPPIASGKYRLYYTLSTEAKPHFYKSWGNIHKQP